MKKLVIIVAAFLTLNAFAMRDTPSKIIGSWKYLDRQINWTMHTTFHSDGTVDYSDDSSGVYQGTYRIIAEDSTQTTILIDFEWGGNSGETAKIIQRYTWIGTNGAAVKIMFASHHDSDRKDGDRVVNDSSNFLKSLPPLKYIKE